MTIMSSKGSEDSQDNKKSLKISQRRLAVFDKYRARTFIAFVMYRRLPE